MTFLMKYRLKTIFCVSVLAVFAFFCVLNTTVEGSSQQTKVHGQKGSESRSIGHNVAVINIDYVVQNAHATKDIQNRADLKRDELQKQVESFEKMLRAEQETLTDLVNQKNPMAQDKKAAFENKVTDVRNKIGEKSKILSEVFGEARQKVYKNVTDIVAKLAKEKGYSLVLSSNVVIYQDGYDISEDVLALVNKQLPKVEFNLPDQELMPTETGSESL